LTVITTADPQFCPICADAGVNSPMVKLGRNDRTCNTCGFVCTVVTASDEEDAKADRQVRSRGYNEEHNRGHKIEKGQTRW
jgi:hypothetical protein